MIEKASSTVEDAARAGEGAPGWANRRTAEDGGVTYELVSAVHPRVAWSPGFGRCALDHLTDVSVSVVDRRRPGGRWVRSGMTVQVEGGSYSLAEIRRLHEAIDELLAAVGAQSAPGKGRARAQTRSKLSW